MKKPLLIAFVLISSLCFAQKKRNIYFLKNDGRYVSVRDSADYLRVVEEPDSGSNLYNIFEYYLNGNKKSAGLSSTIDPPHYEGRRIEYFHSGIKKKLSIYKNMSIVDDEYQFYPNGKPYLLLKYPSVPDNTKGGEFDDYLITANYDSTGTASVTDGNGSFKLYDDDFKNVIEWGTIKNGRRDGDCTGIADKGRSHFTEKYDNGVLVSGALTNEKGETSTYTRSRSIEPLYPGGLLTFYKYLSKKIRYPGYEFNHDITGTVLLSFVVEKNGKVTDIKIIDHVSSNIDKEALRVMKESPQWIPGTQFGKPVRVEYRIPINFSLQ